MAKIVELSVIQPSIILVLHYVMHIGLWFQDCPKSNPKHLHSFTAHIRRCPYHRWYVARMRALCTVQVRT